MHLKSHPLVKAVLFSAMALSPLAADAASVSTVATLTATDVVGGVEFVLDPNEASPGAKGVGGVDSFVKQLQFVYSGSLSGSLTPTNVSGVSIQSVDVGNNANMDAGYKSDAGYITVDYFDNAPNRANPLDARFNFSQTSTFTLAGLSLDDLINVTASANNKPSPTSGIISVAPYECPNCNPNTSNWVTGPGPSAVPVPAAAWLLGSGLMGLASLAKRRKA